MSEHTLSDDDFETYTVWQCKLCGHNNTLSTVYDIEQDEELQCEKCSSVHIYHSELL